MHSRPDMLRQQLPQNMLGMGAQPYPQQGIPQNQLNGYMGNPQGGNPPMGMLGGGIPGSNPMDRTQIQMQHLRQQQQHQQNMLQQAQNVQSAGSALGGGPPPGQIPNVGFPGNMMPQGNPQQVRRAASQSQLMNQTAGHMAGLPPGQPGAMPGMGMPMTAQVRQQNQHFLNNNLRVQQMAGNMNPDPMVMQRQSPANMPPTGVRSASAQAQLMGNMAALSQSSTLPPSHAGALQPAMQQSNFSSALPLTRQHQQNPMTSSPRAGGPGHAPGGPMPNTVPNQGVANRPHMSPDNPLFPNFQNAQAHMATHNSRLQANNSQFGFGPPSSTPGSHNDVPPSIPDGMNPMSTAPGRTNFLSTPAQIQQMESLQRGNDMPPPYSMVAPPNSVPPRPLSHNNHRTPAPRPPSQQQTLVQRSPRQADPLMSHPPHPQRPQSQQGPQGRSPSQPARTGTPQAAPPQLPGQGFVPSTRMPSTPQSQAPQAPQPPSQGQGASGMSAGVRPPGLGPAAGPSTVPSTGSQPEGSMQAQAALAARNGPSMTPPVGLGQGLGRLQQFSGSLANKHQNKLQLSFWKSIVDEYFTKTAMMKFTLWKDNQRNEAKPFEIGVPILPRFFLVTSQAGVESMSLTLDGARERLISAGHAVVECVTAVWTYKYSSGYTVTLRGPLTAHIHVVPQSQNANMGVSAGPPNSGYTLKFDILQFDANFHDKLISLEAILGQRIPELPRTPLARNMTIATANGSASQQRPDDETGWDEPRIRLESASIPGEPVNAFGIPQATMRCLELAESVAQMAELIGFSLEHDLGPLDSLKKFADQLRESQGHLVSIHPGAPLINGANSGGGFTNFPNSSGVVSTPAVTLYSTPPQNNAPNKTQGGLSTSSPKNTPMSANNSPQRQNKQTPQMAQTGTPAATASSTTASTPTSSVHTITPLMPNATLKRKQGTETASPTSATTDQQPPPAKRTARKRGRGTG